MSHGHLRGRSGLWCQKTVTLWKMCKKWTGWHWSVVINETLLESIFLECILLCLTPPPSPTTKLQLSWFSTPRHSSVSKTINTLHCSSFNHKLNFDKGNKELLSIVDSKCLCQIVLFFTLIWVWGCPQTVDPWPLTLEGSDDPPMILLQQQATETIEC